MTDEQKRKLNEAAHTLERVQFGTLTNATELQEARTAAGEAREIIFKVIELDKQRKPAETAITDDTPTMRGITEALQLLMQARQASVELRQDRDAARLEWNRLACENGAAVAELIEIYKAIAMTAGVFTPNIPQNLPETVKGVRVAALTLRKIFKDLKAASQALCERIEAEREDK